MKFNKINPNNSRLNSYQFQLSQKIFGKRISLNLNRDEAAKLTGLSLNTYAEIEQGIDLESSEEKYQQVLNKLSGFSKLSNLLCKQLFLIDRFFNLLFNDCHTSFHSSWLFL